MRRPSPVEERRAFEQLFRETREDLLAYLVRRSPRAEDAADTLAETYLIAWRRFDAIPPGDAARLWLFGVARNLLMKGATRHRVQDALAERLAGELRAGAPEPIDDARSEALRVAVAALPASQREVILLTAWEGLTPKQIATVTGAPVNVVRVRLHRARNRLKHELELSAPAGVDRRRERASSTSAPRAGRA